MAKTRSQVKSEKKDSIKNKKIERSSAQKHEHTGFKVSNFSIVCERSDGSQIQKKKLSLSCSNGKKTIIRNIKLKIDAAGLQIDNGLKMKSAENRYNMTISVKENEFMISSNDKEKNQQEKVIEQCEKPTNSSHAGEMVARLTRSRHQLISLNEKAKNKSDDVDENSVPSTTRDQKQLLQIVKQTRIVSKLIAPTLNSLIDSSWRQCKSIQQQLDVEMIVMAKMRTFSPWPARILEINHTKKRAKVYFFGSNNEGSVDMKEIVEFKKAAQTVRFLLIRNDLIFVRAVKEVERILGIPDHLSLLKVDN